jgi:uncharacterized iron-regulated membrane protein
MRRTLVLLHRGFGLASAGFLFLAGITGAIIAWDHELDEALNPKFYRSSESARTLTSSEAIALAESLEVQRPEVRVRYLPLGTEPGHALQLFAEPRPGSNAELDFDQIVLDPQSGEVQAQRKWGEVSLRRENIMSFLYALHYTLHMPERAGVLLMGVVALVWVFDAFVALALSFPQRKHWRRSFEFRWTGGSTKLTFDLHRSGGVWTWLLVLVIAVTAVSMNLGEQVMRPLVSVFSKLPEDPWDQTADPAKAGRPPIGRTRAVELARADAAKRGITAPPGGLVYAELSGFYVVGFFSPGGDHGESPLGNPWIFLDAYDGQVLAAEIPGEGSAGDVFMQAQFPLHSGRIFGLAGRIGVTLLGLTIAMLSATGVLLWLKKRRKRPATQNFVPIERFSGHDATLGTPPERGEPAGIQGSTHGGVIAGHREIDSGRVRGG